MANKLKRLFDMCLIAQSKGHDIKFENNKYGTTIYHFKGERPMCLELEDAFADAEYDVVYEYLERLCA